MGNEHQYKTTVKLIVFVDRVLPRREVSMPYVTWNALLNTTEVSKSVLNRPLEWPCRVSGFPLNAMAFAK
jgi:hypothetical protein